MNQAPQPTPFRPLHRRDRFESYDEAQAIAKRRLPRSMFQQLSTGIDRGLTLHANVHDFDHVNFRPRAGVAVEQRDQSTTVLGTPISLPVLAAPVGALRLIHPDGILAVARAAAGAGTICARSMVAGHSATEVAAASNGPLWQQLYMHQGREFAEKLMAEAAGAGYQALVVTIDSAAEARRNQPLHMNLRNARLYAPELVVRPRWTARFVRDGMQLGVANGIIGLGKRGKVKIARWEDFGWIRDAWHGPLVIKGIVTADDARRSLDVGADAIVVSNHGGFMLDGAPSTISALPEVLGAVAGRAEVLLDSGVRLGSDVVKAVAMGAKAVLIGRPFAMGLAVAGELGARHVFEMFRYEIDRTLGMVGCPTLAELDPSFVEIPDAWTRRGEH